MKFFCIGAFSSGSKTTRDYLESLGMSVVEWGVIESNFKTYPRNMGEIIKSIDDYDVFSDIPYSYTGFIEKMMDKYPDALFFLSMKDKFKWLKSIKHDLDVDNFITKDTLKEVGIIGDSDEDLKNSYIDRNCMIIDMFQEANQLDRLCTFNVDGTYVKSTIDGFLEFHGCEIRRGVDSF